MIIFNFPLLSLFIMKLMQLFEIIFRFQNKPEPIKIVKKNPIAEYLTKYTTKFNNLETIELDDNKLQNLKNCILYEQTPYGSIIMKYEPEFKKFSYYSDKTIPYNFLETACKRYALSFNCKSLYVDINEQYDMVKDKIRRNEERKEEQEQETAKNEKSIYVKPKAYNRRKKPKSRATIDENKNKIIDFKYCGRIIDFKFLKTNLDVVKKLKTKNISFSEFKNRSNI
jgi:hypothetical protein